MENFFPRASVRARIRRNPIARVLEEYVAYLEHRGHVRGSLRQYVYAAEHFGRWLGKHPISREFVEKFVSSHLPTCRCKGRPRCRQARTIRPALNQLLEMQGVPRMPPACGRVVGRLLSDYEQHLRGTSGLAESTTKDRSDYARDLLEHFGVHQVRQLRGWRPTEIAEYVAGRGRRCKASSGGVLASSIRSFLRFALLHKLTRRDLSAAVPSFANWRLSTVPRIVERSELEKLLNTFDTSTPMGLRDRGILLCLMDLGLRAADVAAIKLEGIDFDGGVLGIQHCKERRTNELPMSARLTSALRTYLRRGRPPSSSAELFVFHRAPVGRRLGSIGIRDMVVRRAARAGVKGIGGTHVIRHSVASTLINAGISMKDIADLLGHRSINTTAIYAKVDLISLRRVARRWPGGSR